MGFVRAPQSISEAAAAFSMNLKTLHYHVRRLVGLGLLAEVAQRARGGRPIKLYRAVSKAFYVSGAAAPKLFSDELSRELRDCLERRSSRADAGIIFTASLGGSPRARTLVAGRAPSSATEMWAALRLSKAEANCLRQDLLAILKKYERTAGKSGGEIFLVHTAMARRLEQEGLADND